MDSHIDRELTTPAPVVLSPTRPRASLVTFTSPPTPTRSLEGSTTGVTSPEELADVRVEWRKALSASTVRAGKSVQAKGQPSVPAAVTERVTAVTDNSRPVGRSAGRSVSAATEHDDKRVMNKLEASLEAAVFTSDRQEHLANEARRAVSCARSAERRLRSAERDAVAADTRRGELVRALWQLREDLGVATSVLKAAARRSVAVRTAADRAALRGRYAAAEEPVRRADALTRWLIANYFSEDEKLHLGSSGGLLMNDGSVGDITRALRSPPARHSSSVGRVPGYGPYGIRTPWIPPGSPSRSPERPLPPSPRRGLPRPVERPPAAGLQRVDTSPPAGETHPPPIPVPVLAPER